MSAACGGLTTAWLEAWQQADEPHSAQQDPDDSAEQAGALGGAHLQPLSVACRQDEPRAMAGKAQRQLLSQPLLRKTSFQPNEALHKEILCIGNLSMELWTTDGSGQHHRPLG